MMDDLQKYGAVVIGASAGGMKVIKDLLIPLSKDFTLPIIIVHHISDSSDGGWTNVLNKKCAIHVKEADEKETIMGGTVYFAPANYHLLVEPEKTFSLSIDEKVNYARPAIDVLFETAGEAYQDQLVGIVLTGSNFDGARGLLFIKENGGLTIVQDPETAEAISMPQAAIEMVQPDYVLKPEKISEKLLKLHFDAIRLKDQ